MPDHDPNGVDWQPAWKVYGYSSFEAYIESKAGASPPGKWRVLDDGTLEFICAELAAGTYDWPMPEPPPYPADDEGQAVPDA